jgi:hypothetical protein
MDANYLTTKLNPPIFSTTNFYQDDNDQPQDRPTLHCCPSVVDGMHHFRKGGIGARLLVETNYHEHRELVVIHVIDALRNFFAGILHHILDILYGIL